MAASPSGDICRHRFGARVVEDDPLLERASEIEEAGNRFEGIGSISRIGRSYPVRLSGVPTRSVPRVRDAAIAVGGSAASLRREEPPSADATSLVLRATWDQYRRLVPKLRNPPIDMNDLADELDRVLRAYLSHGVRTVPGTRRSLMLGDRPRVMGVLNVTPDSFSDGGHFIDPATAIHAAERMVADGADILDVGGESTRPHATPVLPEVEWERLAPVLAGLRGRVSVPISVDTRHAEVAARAIEAGADFINDVEGLRSEAMRATVARTHAGVVVMHMRGVPATMQDNLEYADLRGEVFSALADATEAAQEAGVAPERILVDPGLGFGKSAAQSLELLVHAGEFRCLGYPVVVGASRKSFLGALLGNAGPLERLEAGLAAAVVAAERGVALIRTHDVRPTVLALKLVAAARGRDGGPLPSASVRGARPDP